MWVDLPTGPEGDNGLLPLILLFGPLLLPGTVLGGKRNLLPGPFLGGERDLLPFLWFPGPVLSGESNLLPDPAPGGDVLHLGLFGPAGEGSWSCPYGRCALS